MITIEQYFGHKPHSEAQRLAAQNLLDRHNAMVDEAVSVGAFVREIDPDTGTEISGTRGGAGDGGFRLQTATTGKSNSAHKCLPPEKPLGAAVDQYDPHERLDNWLSKYDLIEGRNSKLEQYDLYREAPHATVGWCHTQTRKTGSGNRTFIP